MGNLIAKECTSTQNPRWERLKGRLLSTKPVLESERMRILTQAYKETEGQPTILRRAKALGEIPGK